MLAGVLVVRQAGIFMQCRDREHAWEHVRQRPGEYRGNIDAEEQHRRHPERARRDRHEGADRRYKAREKYRKRSPALEERLALRHHSRISRHRPGAENFALRAMAGPERRAVADQGAGDRCRQHAPQLQFASRHQRAQGKDDGRARHQRPHHRNRLQKGREKQRQVGQPRMGRDERDDGIEE
jgi:hypothetical protein